MLLYLSTSIHNFVNVITNRTFNELTYKFQVNDTLNLLENMSIENYNRLRQIKRELIEKVMFFVNVMHKRRYDVNYIFLELKIENYAFLKFHVDYIISNFKNFKLNQQRVELFKI